MPRLVFVLMSCFVVLSCQSNTQPPQSFFDSLVNAQVKMLVAEKATVTKRALINGKTDLASFTPDIALWKNELDIFTQLGLLERSAYRTAYVVTDKGRDPGSNLLIKAYDARYYVPVPTIKFYYHRRPDNLKKIVAVYQEKNSLYNAARTLTMEFDDIHGYPQLSLYSITGMQKMILSDTVRFSVQSTIHH